jgi:multidrug efflux pump subunit AcrA (membrane-fusion protein)
MPFFYVPLKAADKPVGVVQVWQRPGRDPKNFRAFAEFLLQIALYAESFLESRHLETVFRETERLEQLLLVTERLAASDSAEALAREVANLGRDLVSADRLTVLAAERDTCRTLATSGQAKPERRSEVLQSLEELAHTAVEAQAARAYSRPAAGETDVPDAVRRHFSASTLEMIVLMPLRRGSSVVGVMAAEYATANERPSDEDLAALESMSRQVGPALTMRLESERLPLRRTARVLAALSPRRGKRKPLALAACALVLLVAALLPIRIDIEGHCTVWPTNRAVVVAHEDGRVAEVLVDEGQQVEAGQPLVRLEHPALTTALTIARGEVQRWEAEAQQAEARGDPSAVAVAMTRMKKAEGEVAALQARVAELTLYAPMAGTIVTRDPKSNLGDNLKRGEKILDVADLQRWEVVVELPEADVLALEEALAAGGEEGTGVEFLLASRRGAPLTARVTSPEQISPTARLVGGRNVFLVRATIPAEQLEGVDLRVGYEGQARVAGPSKTLLRAAIEPVINRVRMAMF